MSTQLLESDFITINIGSLLNNTTSNTQINDETTAIEEPSEKQSKTRASTTVKQTNFDWGEELKSRLEANKKMSPESRRNEYDLETQFFKEFFSSNWDAECAKQLMLMGDPLRKALKVLGFKERINPILGFIKLPYVQKNLIKTKLLNINTFKAIYKAVANRWIADSEFFRVSDYNIIYCMDLYTKTLAEIEEYLELQSKVLEVSASKYTGKLQAINKKVFIFLPSVKELDPKKRVLFIKDRVTDDQLISVKSTKAKLNTIAFVKLCITEIAKGTLPTKADKSHLSSSGRQNLVKKLDTPAKMLAAIQFISINTDSTEAKNALQNDMLKGVSTNHLLAATQWLATQNIMPKGQLSTADADSLVSAILSNLQR